MTKEEFGVISSSIPNQPGCYKYFDENNELLYVGKAKDLKKRVSSYFYKTQDNNKTRRLVYAIHHIEFTVTDSEHDAFLLESSLIKHYQPRYNISLKDDKSYPYIVIKKEHFPRVFFTRKLIRDGSEYLGPFTGLLRVKELLEIIKQNIPLRTCNLNLSPQQIKRGKYKVCLEYHLGNCNGPCQGFQTESEYLESIKYVRHVLKGNIQEVVRFLKTEMQQCAERLEFEKAEVMKQKVLSLQGYQSRSTIVNPKLGNMDIISMVEDEHNFYVNFMMLSNGVIIFSKSVLVERKLEEAAEDVYAYAFNNLRDSFQSNSLEVIAPIHFLVNTEQLKVTVPKAGDKKQLLELSFKNATAFKDELKKKNTLLLKPDSKEEQAEILEELQESLQLATLPLHIECFDNSNFQGSYPVAAMVCFRHGIPAKKDYRHFHIKTVEGINDFASMSEVVYRRYKRLMDEKKPLPDLVIIDGGKGQLNAALQSIEKLGLTGRMTLVGLAKREESIFFPHDSEPLQLPFDSKAHLLIRRIRDEVHRFGITFHRQTRSKGTIKNELSEIQGIGPQTAISLLKAFKSVKHIKTLSEREIAGAIGSAKARLVFDYFNK